MDTPALDRLDELMPQLRGLRRLAPVDRAVAARDVLPLLRAALALVGDEAMTHAVGLREHQAGDRTEQRLTYLELADRLELSHSRVNHCVTRYRLWRSRRLTPTARG